MGIHLKSTLNIIFLVFLVLFFSLTNFNSVSASIARPFQIFAPNNYVYQNLNNSKFISYQITDTKVLNGIAVNTVIDNNSFSPFLPNQLLLYDGSEFYYHYNQSGCSCYQQNNLTLPNVTADFTLLSTSSIVSQDGFFVLSANENRILTIPELNVNLPFNLTYSVPNNSFVNSIFANYHSAIQQTPSATSSFLYIRYDSEYITQNMNNSLLTVNHVIQTLPNTRPLFYNNTYNSSLNGVTAWGINSSITYSFTLPKITFNYNLDFYLGLPKEMKYIIGSDTYIDRLYSTSWNSTFNSTPNKNFGDFTWIFIVPFTFLIIVAIRKMNRAN